MKELKRMLLKILAGMGAAVLIAGILFIANAFVGNPITAMKANRAIAGYVNVQYPDLNLAVGKVSYNFKDGAYMARAASRTSIDTWFAIYYGNGEVQRDYYEAYVLGMHNTMQRFSTEYSALAQRILAEEMGYQNNHTTVIYNREFYQNAPEILTLDMEFDRSLPINAEIMMRFDIQDSSLEGIAKLFEDAHRAFMMNNCYFYQYGFSTENNGQHVSVSGVTPEDIDGGELVELLNRAVNHRSVNGISIFIKEPK